MENPETIINIPTPTGPDIGDVQSKPTSEAGGSVTDNTTRLCPLCNAVVRLFYINLDEKMLMCANAECDFPFGYEELVFVRLDESNKIDYDNTSVKSKLTQDTVLQGPTPTGSVISEGCWSDIDKMNRVVDSEDSQSSFAAKILDPKDFLKSSCVIKKLPVTLTKKDASIKKSLEKLKEIDKKIQEFEPKDTYIKNKEILKQLQEMQCGMREKMKKCLLKPEELMMISNDKPTPIDTPKVQVDILTNEVSLPMININIGPQLKDEK